MKKEDNPMAKVTHVSALGGQLTVQNPPRAVRRMLDLAHITYV